MGVERTRATFLSYSKQDQANFTADLRMLLEPSSHVDLVQENSPRHGTGSHRTLVRDQPRQRSRLVESRTPRAARADVPGNRRYEIADL